MAVLGLIIALAAGAYIASAWLSSTDLVSLTALGNTMTTSVGRLVGLGALAGLLFALGLTLLFSGIGRSSRRRRETKQVVVDTRTEAEELRLENERLARELQTRDSYSTGTVGGAVGGTVAGDAAYADTYSDGGGQSFRDSEFGTSDHDHSTAQDHDHLVDAQDHEHGVALGDMNRDDMNRDDMNRADMNRADLNRADLNRDAVTRDLDNRDDDRNFAGRDRDGGMVDSGALQSDGTPTSTLYVDRDATGAPVAYPDEPARDDAVNRSDVGRDQR